MDILLGVARAAMKSEWFRVFEEVWWSCEIGWWEVEVQVEED
jgi:hypothetical protein